jgi:DNA-binding MarR family transcriptional regulator
MVGFARDMETATTAGALVLLTRMSRLIHRQVDPDKLGMSMKEFSTLNIVRDAGGITQRELSTVMAVDANMVVNLLNSLEKRGFAVRERDPDDRRRHVVRVTAKGTRALVRAEEVIEESTDAVLGDLDESERTQLRGLLAKALGNGAAAPVTE